MLKKADAKDKLSWVRLNKEFMSFEVQDGELWNHVDEAKDEELADVFDEALKKPEHQGRGYGRQVMKEIEDYAREKGYKRLQFQSEETNPAAKAFYRKLGYRPADMNFYVRYL